MQKHREQRVTESKETPPEAKTPETKRHREQGMAINAGLKENIKRNNI